VTRTGKSTLLWSRLGWDGLLRGACGGGAVFEGPDDDGDVRGVEDGGVHGADGPCFEEGVFGDVDGGAMEGPARVVDFTAEDAAAAVGGVETVAFGGPCFEGFGWRGDGFERLIGRVEAEVAALVLIVDGVA
jgi:hypothetical protein